MRDIDRQNPATCPHDAAFRPSFKPQPGGAIGLLVGMPAFLPSLQGDDRSYCHRCGATRRDPLPAGLWNLPMGLAASPAIEQTPEEVENRIARDGFDPRDHAHFLAVAAIVCAEFSRIEDAQKRTRRTRAR